MKTFHPTKGDDKKQWYVVDADEKILGRLATSIATVLRGKHKATYTPSMDMGDFVIVVNADKIGVTGKKLEQKTYYRHSGYPGGIRGVTLEKLMEKKPTEALKKAVTGMLPKGPLGRDMLSKLKVYAGPEHPHAAQKPEAFPF